MAKEEKVLENGREQGPDMGMRTVRDLAVCRGREGAEVLWGAARVRGKGEGISRAKGSMRIRALIPPAPLPPWSHQSLPGTGLGTGSGTTW